MLTKLLKYDIKNIFKSLIPIYLVSLLIAITTDLMLIISGKINALSVISGLMLFFAIIIIFLTPIIAFILSIVDFHKKLTKDEGYLIHTLPVKKSKIITSKIITALIAISASLISSLISLIVLTLKYSDKYTKVLDLLKYFIEQMTNNFNESFLILLILNLIIGIILNLLNIYASIALGQMHNDKKTLFAVIYYIVTYNAIQIISSIITLIPIIFNPKLLKSMSPPVNEVNMFLTIALILSIAFSIIFYIITVKIFENKLNLE